VRWRALDQRAGGVFRAAHRRREPRRDASGLPSREVTSHGWRVECQGPVTAAEERHGERGVQGAHVRAQGCASSRRPRDRRRDEEDRAIPEGSRGGGAGGEWGCRGATVGPPAGSGRRPAPNCACPRYLFQDLRRIAIHSDDTCCGGPRAWTGIGPEHRHLRGCRLVGSERTAYASPTLRRITARNP
jgi:hypothetical protein